MRKIRVPNSFLYCLMSFLIPAHLQTFEDLLQDHMASLEGFQETCSKRKKMN